MHHDGGAPAPAVDTRAAPPLYPAHPADGRRHRGRRDQRAGGHPHRQRVEGGRFPAQWRDAQAARRLSAPRPRPVGGCRQQGRPHPPDQDDEGDGLRRHPHQPQHAEPDADAGVRLTGHDGHGRVVRHVDIPQVQERLRPFLRGVERPRHRAPRAGQPQPPQHRHVEHRQRDSRAGRQAGRRHHPPPAGPLPPARPLAPRHAGHGPCGQRPRQWLCSGDGHPWTELPPA